MLFIHTLVSFARITQVIFSDGGWLLTEHCTTSEQSECIGNYNKALLEPHKDEFKNALVASIFIGLALDIACIRWRFLAQLFIYHEIMLRILAVLYPNFYGFKESGSTQLLTYAVTFVLFYCEDPAAIVINALAYGFCNFWIEIAYERGIGVYEAGITIFSILMLFGGECAAGMVQLKIANLYKNLATSN